MHPILQRHRALIANCLEFSQDPTGKSCRAVARETVRWQMTRTEPIAVGRRPFPTGDRTLDPGDVFVSEPWSTSGRVADSEMQQPDDAPTLADVGLEQLEHFRIA